MKFFSIAALAASASAVRLDVVPVDKRNFPGVILSGDKAIAYPFPKSSAVDDDFNPMFNRQRYGTDFVNGSSLAEAPYYHTTIVSPTPSTSPDKNFDPEYNRFRYGNTFVKGSSMAQEALPYYHTEIVSPTPSTSPDKNFDPEFNRFRYGKTFVKGSSMAQDGQTRHETRQRIAHQLRASLVQLDGPTEMNMLQTSDEICETVECAKQQAAQMQAQLDAGVAEADAKRDAQEAAFKSQDSNDPAAQLQGLMNAQASLKRLTTGFTSKPNVDKVTTMAQKLGIPMTPELMQLGNNEAISNALVEIAVGMGKSEMEITKALGPDEQ